MPPTYHCLQSTTCCSLVNFIFPAESPVCISALLYIGTWNMDSTRQIDYSIFIVSGIGQDCFNFASINNINIKIIYFTINHVFFKICSLL